ncbi:MAG: PhnD/SsuA/transferrin family substrate-binding protein [Immundisolibacteraceae bacterium]|nr:PhnD/SsuA/transferrin family substrate-binding protein [Immundisolibacteraceae bacterium]
MTRIQRANKISAPLLALTLAVLLCTLSPGQAKAEVELTFGLYTSDKASVMISKFRKILNAIEVDLTSRLGEPVTIKTRVAKSYEQGVTDLTSGKVDFSRFGAVSYVFAKQQQDAITILAVENSNGS